MNSPTFICLCEFYFWNCIPSLIWFVALLLLNFPPNTYTSTYTYICVCACVFRILFQFCNANSFFVSSYFSAIFACSVCVCAARNSAKKPRSRALSEATNAHATQVATKLNSFQLHFATFFLLYMLSFKNSMTFCWQHSSFFTFLIPYASWKWCIFFIFAKQSIHKHLSDYHGLFSGEFPKAHIFTEV